MNQIIDFCGGKTSEVMKYNDIDILFPKMNQPLTEVIKGSTKKDKQLDHLLVSDSIEILNAKIIDNIADHKCIMAEIKI